MFHEQRRAELAKLAEDQSVSTVTARRWQRADLIVWADGDRIDLQATRAALAARGIGAARKQRRAQREQLTDETQAIERRKQTALARLHELDVLEREGKLVSDDEARVFAFSLADEMLDRIAELPARHAHEVAVELHSTPAQVRAALARVVDPMLVELASDLQAE